MTDSSSEQQTPSGPSSDQLVPVCQRLFSLGTESAKSWETLLSQAEMVGHELAPMPLAAPTHVEKLHLLGVYVGWMKNCWGNCSLPILLVFLPLLFNFYYLLLPEAF